MIPVVGRVQKYAWGRHVATSEVAQLAAANGQDVNSEDRYAELWMGTHPNGPSSVAGVSGQSLKDWVQQHPEALGIKVFDQFAGDLPFLLKVLSIDTALSIQSHPDKALAEKLHRLHPEIYKDENHKPEMALAISDFEALCGFVEMQQLQDALRQHPELTTCIGDDTVEEVLCCSGSDKAVLKAAFTALMTCPSETVESALGAMVMRLEEQQDAGEKLGDKEELVLRLNEQYPRDVGVLSIFFLNYLKLHAGEAIYLAANEPHAYLSGQCVECMAASDNVIRAGLTPKYRDTEVLCSSLTYDQGLPEILRGEPISSCMRRYAPPLDEFEVVAIEVPPGQTTTIPENEGPTMLLVEYGEGLAVAARPSVESAPVKAELLRGGVFFIPASTLVVVSDVRERLVMWAARCNYRFFERVVVQPQVQVLEGFMNGLKVPEHQVAAVVETEGGRPGVGCCSS